jgi:hypothetical protein
MKNEFINLTDLQAIEMYMQAMKANRQSPRIMPYNDREYLLRREIALRQECIRRGLLLISGQ